MAKPSARVARELARTFEASGYVRRKNEERANEQGQGYKKGDEARFIVESEEELARVQALLEDAGFRVGKPFAKGRKWRLPVYGRKQVADLLELVGP